MRASCLLWTLGPCCRRAAEPELNKSARSAALSPFVASSTRAGSLPGHIQRGLCVKVADGYVTLPELPGTGFEGKADLYAVMKELAG